MRKRRERIKGLERKKIKKYTKKLSSLERDQNVEKKENPFKNKKIEIQFYY
jgi:hypothetical protein